MLHVHNFKSLHINDPAQTESDQQSRGKGALHHPMGCHPCTQGVNVVAALAPVVTCHGPALGVEQHQKT